MTGPERGWRWSEREEKNGQERTASAAESLRTRPNYSFEYGPWGSPANGRPASQFLAGRRQRGCEVYVCAYRLATAARPRTDGSYWS